MVTPAITDVTIQPAVQTPAPLAIEPSPTPEITTPAPTTPAPSTQPPAFTPPSELDYLRRELAQVRTKQQEEATEAALVAEARAKQQEAMARGFNEQDALWVAQTHYAAAKRASQQQQEYLGQQRYLEGKQNAAMHFGRLHGVDPTILMTASTPAEMDAIGQREKRWAAQDSRLKAVEQAQVPAQRLDSANGSSAGGPAITTDNIDKLWFDHEVQHPNMANPFEAAYRKFLGV